MQYSFKPKGVCARQIDFSIEDGIIKDVSFTGGCAGNTQGLSKLCVGRKPEEIKELLSGIKCGFKSTSCPDQLAKALDEAIKKG